MIVSVEVHPDRERLAAYADGKLPAAEADEVASHLAACPACRDAIQSLPDDDRLVVLLRSLPAEMRPAASIEDIPAALRDHPRYEILEEVGRGGMGVVYKARHRVLGREVAVKVIKGQASEAAVGRFLGEARAAACIDSPRVVRVLDAEHAGGLVLIAMEYVEGIDLARLVNERGPLPVHEACGYARQMALGLADLHAAGLVHRDAKPSNAMLCRDGTVKLLDLGLASLLEDPGPADASPAAETPHASGSLTRLGGRGLGTPDFVAPEQAVDARLADARSDVYSLGATLYFLLAGRPPFGEGDASRRVLGHMVLTPTPIREVRPDVPAALAAVLATMMAKNPAKRFQTPDEAAAALASFTSPARWGRRGFLVAAGLGLAGLAGLAWWAFAPRQARLVMRLAKHPAPIQALALSPDDRFLLTGCDDRRLRLFDLASGELLREWEAHGNWAVSVCWMPDSRHALSGSTEGTLRTWDITEGKLVHEFPDHGSTVLCIAVSPDGSKVLTGSDNRAVRLFDTAGGKQLHAMAGHAMPVQCVAFSRDGAAGLSGGNDRIVRVWDIASGRLVQRLEGHTHVVTGLLPLEAGRAISCCFDQTTRLWDASTGRQDAVRSYPLPPKWLFERAGRLLAACKDDAGRLRLADARTGDELCRFVGHADAVWGFGLTQDGRRAASADREGVVIVWELDDLHQWGSA